MPLVIAWNSIHSTASVAISTGSHMCPPLEHDHMMRASEGAVQIAHLPGIEVYRRAA